MGCGYELADGEPPSMEIGKSEPVVTVAGGNATQPTPPEKDPIAEGVVTVIVPVGEAPGVVAPAVEYEDRLLLSDAAYVDVVGFSDDGSTVAYFKQTAGLGSDLYVARLESGETRMVDKNVIAILPHEPIVLSPDGSSVMYRRTLDGGAGSWHNMSDLWAWTWASGEAWMVSKGVYQGSYRFTPDGQQVVYLHTQAKDLYVYDLATQEGTVLSDFVVPHGNNAMQNFPMSADGKYLAYLQGYGGNASLHIVDLDTYEQQQLATQVVPRSARFVGEDQYLAYTVGKGALKTISQYHIETGDTVSTPPSKGWAFSTDWGHIAYLESSESTGQLYVWSRETGESVSVDSDVKQSMYAWSPTGTDLVYYRGLEQSGSSAWGKLYAWHAAKDVRTLLAAYAWTDGNGPQLTFAPGGETLAYRSGDCQTAANLRLVAIDGSSAHTVAQRTCGAVFARPDGSGFVFTTVEPAHLMEVSCDTGGVTQLAIAPVGQAVSPDATKTVHTLAPDDWVEPLLLVSNWDNANIRIIQGAGFGLKFEAVNDTHLVYSTSGPPSELWLAQLP